MHRTKNRAAVTLIAALAALLAAPTAFASAEGETAAEEEIKIPMLFREGGNDANTVMYRGFIDAFNEKYDGRYELDIEWVPGMAVEIRQKLKALNSARNLPAVVTQLGPEAAFAEALMRDGRLMDQRPYFDADAEWQKVAFPESVEFNTDAEGRMFTSPSTGAPYIGIYYNKEMFAEAGIDAFPTTWDDFFAACETLQAAGFTPLSMHTTETGWITNLLLTTYLGRTQEGRDFMDIRYPTDEFTSEIYIDAVRMVERLYEYTTADAIGGTYALAANHFSASDTAMIANGPWMIASFGDTQYSPEGFEDKVGYARFPNDMMISNLGREYGRGVSMDHDLAVREGAVEWIKFLATRDNIAQQAIALGHMTHLVSLNEDEKAGLGPVNLEYFNAVEGVELTIPWFQAQWDPINQNETIVNQLPALLYGDITAEEYAAMLAASAKEYLESL